MTDHTRSFLSEDELAFIAGYGAIRTFPAQTVLIQEGDRGNDLFVILEGRVRIFLGDEDGREVIINTQGPGEYFGELALIDDEPRSASVMTTCRTKVLVVTREGFEKCIADRPDFAMRMFRALPSRVRCLTEDLRSMALDDVYGRMCRLLKNLAREVDGRWVIEDRPTHQEMAAMIGASREMVSRILKELDRGGYLTVEGKHLVLSGELPTRF